MHSPEHESLRAQRLAYCEDETFWDVEDASGAIVSRRVIVSCDPNRKAWNTVMGPLRDPSPRGVLWLVEFDAKGVKEPRQIHFEGYPEEKDFHPLGVEVWPSKVEDGPEKPSNMFVVNHGRYKTTIEQFTISQSAPTSARYVRTLSTKYFVAPNSIALTSNSSFFVTNDHLLTRRLPSILGKTLPLVETLLALPFGTIAHVSILNEAVPGAAVIRHTFPYIGVPFPNGVSLSPDGQTLAVASSSLAQVYFFQRTPAANVTVRETLKFLHTVQTPFAPDNVAYTEDGRLVAAGHTYYPALLKVAANKTGVHAPSWVAEISPRSAATGSGDASAFDLKAPLPAGSRARLSKTHSLATLYQGDGSRFSGSTTGLHDTRTGKLFVTGLYEEGLLVCHP